jgi:histidyl-tRNA synthetase
MRDLLPAEMARFRRVEAVFRESCLRWGYREVRTPTVEHLFLFTAAGTLSPQMLGRVYSFLDWDGWSGERVVLRPDNTIPTARLYVEHLSEERLARLFYVQNVFRFAEGDEPREEWQCGAELIGDTQPLGDVELVLLGHEVLERLGLGPVTVRLSHPGLVRAVLSRSGLSPAEQLRLYDGILDGDAEALAEVQRRVPDLGASAELLFTLEGRGLGYLANLRAAFGASLPELLGPLQELEAVTAPLAALGLEPALSGALVRNFEYYTGPVFRFEVRDTLVGGGGRYDSLIGLVGGPPVPASGFALYLGRLLRLLADDDEPAPGPVLVEPASREPSLVAAAFRAAALLRGKGWPAQVALQPGQEGEGPRLRMEDGQVVLLPPGSPVGERFPSLEEALSRLPHRS